MGRGPEGWRVWGLALREAGRSLRAVALDLARPARFAGPRQPERLVIAPPDLRTSDPTLAADIYAGYFVFAGRALETGGRSPFSFEPLSEGWGEALYGFGWLRHLGAADTALSRANARALVDDFLRIRAQPLAWRVPVVARRTVAFLNQSPLILDGADHAFYQRVMRALGRNLRHLNRALRDPDDLRRLQAAVALAYGGLCLEGYEALLRRASRVLGRELDRQILADGGHVSRHPGIPVDLLLDLLPLRQTFVSRGLEPPEGLVRAIDRMIPGVRLLRHGDGSLSHFNGMGLSATDHIATILFYDAARSGTLQQGLTSGYDRLEAGTTVVTADVGLPPPLRISRTAHAGTLSFELSSGPGRIVVNCGAPRTGNAAVTRAARETAAHSTIEVEGMSSARFLDREGWRGRRLIAGLLMRRLGSVILSGPERIERSRPDPLRLTASHDGYRGSGVVHERRWDLAADGGSLDGRDILQGEGGLERRAILRFHLSPGVRSAALPGSRAIMLVLPNQETWRFEAEGHETLIEESAFFAATDGTRRTHQLVIRLQGPLPIEVPWRFERLARGAARRP